MLGKQTLASLLFCTFCTFEYIHCYLDNDNAGHKAIETLTGIFSDKVIDESNRYQPHNDLNDWLKSSLM